MSKPHPLCLSLAAGLLPLFLHAQAPDPAAPQATVMKLFAAMAAHDSATVRACFHPSARLQSVGANGKFDLTTLNDFVAAIGKIPANVKIEERLLSSEVRQDGDLATVWSPYEFYVNDKRSHSGVDAFQLIRTTDRGWLIIQIADTRRK